MTAPVETYQESAAKWRERAEQIRAEQGLARLGEFFAREKQAHAGVEILSEPCPLGGTYVFPSTSRHGTATAAPVAKGPGLTVAEYTEGGDVGMVRRSGSLAFSAPSAVDLAEPRAVEVRRSGIRKKRWGWWLETVENRAASPDADPEKLAKQAKRGAVQWAQALSLADRMAAVGAPMYPENRLSIGIYDKLADTVEMLPSVRRLNMLAPVAAARRADQLLFAEYHLGAIAAHRRELHTFTAGRRLRTGLLRRGLKGISKKLGEMTRQRWYSRVAEMVWRGEEIGGLTLGPKSAEDYNRRHGIPVEVKAEGIDGAVRWVPNPAAYKAGDLNPEAWKTSPDLLGRDPLWHVHAHCIVVFHEGVTEAQRAEFWRKCRAFWGRVCDRGMRDDGSTHIENLREAIKYPAKPADLDLLTGFQLIDLFDAVSRLKIILPRAGLRRFRSVCRRLVEKPVRRYTTTGGTELVLGPDHNASRSPVAVACSFPPAVRVAGCAGPVPFAAGCLIDLVTGLPVEKKERRKPMSVAMAGPVQPDADERRFRLGSLGRGCVPMPADLCGPVQPEQNETRFRTATAAHRAAQQAAAIASRPMPDRSTDTAQETDTEPAKPIQNRILAKFCGPDSRPRFVVFNPTDRAALGRRALVTRSCDAYARARAQRAPRAPAARVDCVHNRHPSCTPLAGLADEMPLWEPPPPRNRPEIGRS